MANRLPPSQRPERRPTQNDPWIVIAPPTDGEPIHLTPVSLQDLGAYLPKIRMTYWDGVMNGGYQDPFVFIVHRTSAYAKRNGLESNPEALKFASVTRDGAVKMGLIRGKMPAPVKPPNYGVILATGDEVELHYAVNMAETCVIDMIRADPSCRARLEEENPDLGPLLREDPGYLTDWRR